MSMNHLTEQSGTSAADIDVINSNFSKLDATVDKVTTILIPTYDSGGWTDHTDAGTYYTKDISVADMYPEYIGTQAWSWVRPNPYNQTTADEIEAEASKIKLIYSNTGSVTVYTHEKITKEFSINLYGLLKKNS